MQYTNQSQTKPEQIVRIINMTNEQNKIYYAVCVLSPDGTNEYLYQQSAKEVKAIHENRF